MSLVRVGRLTILTTAYCVLSLQCPPAAAQTTSTGIAGVGRDSCSRTMQALAESDGANDADGEAKLRVHTEYRNWVMGWFTGFNLGSADAGLPQYELDEFAPWYTEVLQSCLAIPADTYSNAVRRVAGHGEARRAVRGGTVRAGLGREECAGMIAARTQPGLAYLQGGYANWTLGFLSGYNALRERVGIAPIEIGDGQIALARVTDSCSRNPNQHVGSSASLWVLEAETQQNAAALPDEATFAGFDYPPSAVSDVSTPAYLAPDGFVGAGYATCEALLERLTGGDPLARRLAEVDALSWALGYLSASDRMRDEERIRRVNWSTVNLQALWTDIKETCQPQPTTTLGSAIKAHEFARLGRPRDAFALLGIANRSCNEFNSEAAGNFDEVLETVYEVIDFETAVRGWNEGFFSAYNNAIFEGRLVTALLDLEQVAQRGFDSAKTFCASNESLSIFDAVLAFGRTEFPAVLPP